MTTWANKPLSRIFQTVIDEDENIIWTAYSEPEAHEAAIIRIRLIWALQIALLMIVMAILLIALAQAARAPGAGLTLGAFVLFTVVIILPISKLFGLHNSLRSLIYYPVNKSPKNMAFGFSNKGVFFLYPENLKDVKRIGYGDIVEMEIIGPRFGKAQNIATISFWSGELKIGQYESVSKMYHKWYNVENVEVVFKKLEQSYLEFKQGLNKKLLVKELCEKDLSKRLRLLREKEERDFSKEFQNMLEQNELNNRS